MATSQVVDHTGAPSSSPSDDSSSQIEQPQSSTQELLERLDSVTATIPRILDNLSGALGTLVPKQQPNGGTGAGLATRDDQWAEHLEKFSAYYYGLLDQVQLDLRSIVRQIRVDSHSPTSLLPPPSNLPLPLVSLPASMASDWRERFGMVVNEEKVQVENGIIEQGVDGKGKGVKEGEAEGKGKESGLGIYAQRLELSVLEDLAGALKGLKEDRQATANLSLSKTGEQGKGDRTGGEDGFESEKADVDMDN